ncbi:MAG: right-handed parallel beta-helix repeat-containing protein [Burkholderiales bacterium]|nr:right-handed parallel beta-helix repeat-containing protein [Burkholderiales bacterium]
MLAATLLSLALQIGPVTVPTMEPPGIIKIQLSRPKWRWRWARPPVVTPPPANVAARGATLPITYVLADLTGTERYVSPTGDDQGGANNCSAVGTPCATISRAHSAASTGDNIILRGGTYRNEFNRTLSKDIGLLAYPDETPTLNGAKVAGTWINETGTLSYTAYVEQIMTDGSGIAFSTGQNLEGTSTTAPFDVGKFSDQAWIGSTALRQVTLKASVVDGTFWVDATNNRLYLTDADAALPNIEHCPDGAANPGALDDFAEILGPGFTIKGITFTRYCNSSGDYGVIDAGYLADSFLMENVVMSESAFQLITIGGTDGLNTNSRVTDSTFSRGGWMGLTLVYTDDIQIDLNSITGMDPFGEFTNSPQSGGIKTSRVWRSRIINNDVKDNNSHGIWFDQSNWDTHIVNNTVTNNNGASVFHEISDRMLLIDNIIQTSLSNAVKLAGSSGNVLINNTIVGGSDVVGIYADERSMPGCTVVGSTICPPGFNNDRDSIRTAPVGMDWFPRLDTMINNIIVFPTSSNFCGAGTAVCIEGANASVVKTVTISNASPAVVTSTAHGFVGGASFYFKTTGALPTGISGHPTRYYVKSTGNTANTFQFSAASGTNGTAVNTSSAGSGTHQVIKGASHPVSSIMHPAEAGRGIPQTLINGNVYADTGNFFIFEEQGVTSSLHSTIPSLQTALQALDIAGDEALGLAGSQYANADGTPTTALTTYAGAGCTGHACAAAVPTDADINAYIAAGTKHFGVTYQ